MKQEEILHKQFDKLHKKYGDLSLCSIYGAGKTKNPDIMFIFMNPTSRNISSDPTWKSIRAPWIGTKQVWEMFYKLKLLDKRVYERIKKIKPSEWTEEFAELVYNNVEQNSIYITNLAKCTQKDARPLRDRVFKKYLKLMYKEIEIVNPKYIVSFGNQVSNVLLEKKVSVSNYEENSFEEMNIKGKKYKVFPTYYPVGQGRRNMSKAVERIKSILL